MTSECGKYQWTPEPYQQIDKESDKVFIMGTGDPAPASDKVIVNLCLREEAQEGHTVGGANQNLLSLVPVVQSCYTGNFEKDTFIVYDSKNTKITVSCATILKGYYDPAIKL